MPLIYYAASLLFSHDYRVIMAQRDISRKNEEMRNKKMKKWLALLLAAVMAFSLCACGEKGTESTPGAEESALTAEQQIIVDAVSAQIQSQTFAQWQELAEQFKGSAPKAPEVTAVLHYEIGDFEGEKMDCYLVNISADVAWWVNEAAQQGTREERYQLYVSSDGKTVMDSVSTDAGNFNGDTSTPEGRATYLLWMFGNMMGGNYQGNVLNDSETITEWSADELAVINANL